MLTCAQGDRRLDQVGKPTQRVAASKRPFDYGRKGFGDALVDDRPRQFSFGGKSAVQRSFSDAGPVRDGVHGRIRSEFGVGFARGAQDAFGVPSSVGTQGTVRYGCHPDTVTDS